VTKDYETPYKNRSHAIVHQNKRIVWLWKRPKIQ